MRSLAILTVPALLAASAGAQQPAAPPPANYVHVSAPLAQRLVLQAVAAHPEIGKLGLHATPEGGTDNAIIASDLPAKIGKKSSAADMQHLAAGRPSVTRIDKEGIFDLLLPITDRAGRGIGDGFVVMEVPFERARSGEDALAIGSKIRDELQRAISSRAALYRP